MDLISHNQNKFLINFNGAEHKCIIFPQIEPFLMTALFSLPYSAPKCVLFTQLLYVAGVLYKRDLELHVFEAVKGFNIDPIKQYIISHRDSFHLIEAYCLRYLSNGDTQSA